MSQAIHSEHWELWAKRGGAVLGFGSRHLVAAAVSVVWPVALVIVTYFVLLVIALVTDGGMGGPLALPFWASIALAASIVYTALILFPAVASAEAAATLGGKWQHLAQIPLSVMFLALISGAWVAIAGSLRQPRLGGDQWFNYTGIVFLTLLMPLGIYWWTMKFAQALLFAVTAVFKWIVRKAVHPLTRV